MSTTDLPALNATLNGIAAVLLVLGLLAIRGGRTEQHKKLMVGALCVSALFLASYLTYHYLHGSTRFERTGPIRVVYLVILISHIILAVVNLPMVIVTVARALKGQFDRHRKIAKLTWVLWMYVSVTGVIVYLMLYQLFPGPA